MARTFTDQWYRVADLRLALRPGLSIRLHQFRGEPWYLLRQRAHNGFFRVNPVTYQFLCRLTVQATVDAIWRDAVEQAPQQTPGQEETFELICALYKANLLQIAGQVDESRLVDRLQAKQAKPLAAKLSEILFLKIPLWDPDRWLNRWRGAIHLLLSLPVLLLAAGVVLWAAWELWQAGPRAWGQTEHLLQLDNLALLFVATLASHMLHELAHAATCKRFGGEVRTMGVMLLMFTPLPYVDLAASWSLRDKWQRVLVGGAGMLADVFTGAVATLIWAYSPPGWVNELAYNLMFTTVIYTVVFNINPLMRFDGYYMLSDAIGIPNLHQQAQQQFVRSWRKLVLQGGRGDNDGSNDRDGPDTGSWRRRAGLLLFYLTSNVYRISVMVGIVLLIADQYLGVGLLVAAAMAVTNFVAPVQRWWATMKQPVFRFQHQRLLQRSAVVVGLLLLALVLIPMPDSRRLSGVIEARNTPLHSDSGGIIDAVLVAHGAPVRQGQLLVRMHNPELLIELQGVQAQRQQTQAMQARAVAEGGADLAPLLERMRTLDTLDAELRRQLAALDVTAPHDGTWVAPDAAHRVSSWVGRGAQLGAVVDERERQFVGVLQQEGGLALSVLAGAQAQQGLSKLGVRIEGERSALVPVRSLTLVPHSQSTLPSAALSPLGGGDVPVLRQDGSASSHGDAKAGGKAQAAESFFLLRADLGGKPDGLTGALGDTIDGSVHHGRSSWIRIDLPASPVAQQLWTWAHQFVQRRYQI